MPYHIKRTKRIERIEEVLYYLGIRRSNGPGLLQAKAWATRRVTRQTYCSYCYARTHARCPARVERMISYAFGAVLGG